MPALTEYVDQLIREILGSTGEIAPFESDERALWAVRQGWIAAFGPGGAGEALAAMPDMADAGDRKDFLAGVVVGVGQTVGAFVTEQVTGIASAIKALIEYYELVYDVDMWAQMLAVWLAPQGTSVEPFARFLQADHPDLYAAITGFAPFVAELDRFVTYLGDETVPLGQKWSVCQQAVANLLAATPQWLGRQLRPHVAAFVDQEGDPYDQGLIVGKVGGRVVIEAALLALGAYQLARSGTRGVAGLAGEAKVALTSGERAAVTATVTKAAPKLPAAATAVSRAEQAAFAIYQELATEIAPYSRLKRKTGAFNKQVRDIFGLSVSDAEYVGLRLDANHIVKNSLYDRFPKDFDRLFGWKKGADMDAFAMPTEFHIRNGDRMRIDLGLHGGEGLQSFSKMLDDFVADWELKNGRFTTVEQVFQAHEAFYRKHTPKHMPRLEPWFKAAYTKIRGGN